MDVLYIIYSNFECLANILESVTGDGDAAVDRGIESKVVVARVTWGEPRD
jgi:hypothetical protein